MDVYFIKKSIPAIIFISILCKHALSQAPDRLSYQAIVRNTSGNVVANQSVGMRITILKGSATGTSVYVETQTRTTNASGLITLEIGGGTPVTGSFATVNWGQGPYFIKTETDVAGGTNYQLTGTSQLLSVPYALFAGDVPVSKNGDTVTVGGSKIIMPGSVLLPSAGPPPSSLSSGLMAYYPFNGNSNDGSGNANHGSVVGATLTTDRLGNPNQAYQFNGQSHYIQVNNSPSLNSPSISISGWFLPQSLPVDDSNSVKELVSKWWQLPSVCNGNYNAYNLSITKPSGVDPRFGAGTDFYAGNVFTSESGIEVDKWTHFVFIHDSNTGGRIYINGRLERSNALSGSICASTNPILIGCDSKAGVRYRFFHGKLDEIRIYNRPLSVAEISYLANY
jgi:hypothetical protein